MIVVEKGKNMCDIPAGHRADGLEQKMTNEREAGESAREKKRLVLTKDFKVKRGSLNYMPRSIERTIERF